MSKGPALKADPRYFEAFARIMAKLASAAPKSGKPIVVCVSGGAAMHFYTGARVSKDIDAKILARFLPREGLEVAYKDRDGHARLLYFDTQFNDSYALLHQSAYDDAIPIEVPGVDAHRLEVRLLTPLDLAVSKLSRFELHDQDDIRSLAREGLIDASALRLRAEDALPDYVGETTRIRTSIRLAEKLVKEARPSA
jgi:hypothetical protein